MFSPLSNSASTYYIIADWQLDSFSANFSSCSAFRLYRQPMPKRYLLEPTSPFVDFLTEEPIVAVTAYDYPSGRICDEAGVDVVLVGDSLGMVVAGLPDTTEVTIEMMCHHTRMAARGVREALVIGDLSADSYNTPDEALSNASSLIEAGAHAVKLEGGLGQIAKVEALIRSGIPVCGHLGMLPQRVKEEGGYKKKGKTDDEAAKLQAAALALEKAGVFAIVLESVTAATASALTDALHVPTIGIGSGIGCGGQIRVLHDLVGGYPWFVPPFAISYANVADDTRNAIHSYRRKVQDGDKT